jgi:uncharacterized protein YdeI (YjbR/CyaY-like superfamily)
MTPKFFKTQAQFRKWLEKHHKREKELIVGFYKVGSKKHSMTRSQSVDQALCFGWIDGLGRTIDDESYSIRFTPRKKTSIWSAINIKKVEELTEAGLMTPDGVKAFSFRTASKSNVYSHENDFINIDAKFEKQFMKNKNAWNFFLQQPPSYRKVTTHWIMSAKQEKTKQSRLEKAIIASEQQKRIN